MTALAAHPALPDRVFAGTACGGVWRSMDRGLHWEPLWDDRETLHIGSLAIDPNNPQIVYCGTGEANASLDSYPGRGVYRSIDGGNTWNLLGGDFLGVPRRIGSLAVDPFDPSMLCMGSVAMSDEDPTSLRAWRIASDGSAGMEFPPPFIRMPNYQCHSVVYHPKRRGVLFVAIDARGGQSGIWRGSSWSGEWKQLSIGLPPNELFGRTSLAIAPSQPDTLYAFAEDRHEGVLGIFRTDDCGGTWRSIGGNHFDDEGQVDYNNCIAVHPDNPDHVICGATDLHRSLDGGRSWQQITEWDLPPGDGHYAHADHHALVMPRGDLIYSGNDGGVDASEDGGSEWKNRSRGLVTTLFYDVDVAAYDGNVYGGGAQDNGTLIREKGAKKGEFTQALKGDGGFMVFDPDEDSEDFATFQHLNIRKGKGTDWSDVTPDANDEERDAVWLAYLAMDASEDRLSRVIYTGTTRIWRSNDAGHGWAAVSGDLDGSAISAIDVASADPHYVYAATEGGGIFRSTDSGLRWSEDLAGPALPRRNITRIEAHPKFASHVLVTLAAVPDKAPWVVFRDGKWVNARYGQVYLSRDYGQSWTSADPENKLPSVPHRSLSFETREPYRLFVASDAGVWMGEWNEKSNTYDWSSITGNLPHVAVMDVVYHAKTRSLTVGTYGRGIWRLKLGGPARRVPR